MEVKNIFLEVPKQLKEELSEEIINLKKIKIERIISKGHSSPKDFWYDQNENEWVIVLKGKARLLFENENVPVVLAEGDYINISAHQKHRVEWTDPEIETIWLAIFY